MSKERLITTISREIETLNEQIDFKIIKGISYKIEAKRHKLLVSMLSDVGRRTAVASRGGFFSFMF